MAKQIGEVILKGTLDGLTFYEIEGQPFVRRRTSLTRKRVKTSKEFSRTMENAREFAGSSLFAKGFKHLFSRYIERERVYFQKIVSVAQAVVKTDSRHRRGERVWTEGNLDLFTGLELNKNSDLFIVPYQLAYDSFGLGLLSLPSFTPLVSFNYAQATPNTYAKLIFCSGFYNETLEGSFLNIAESSYIRLLSDDVLAAQQLIPSYPTYVRDYTIYTLTVRIFELKDGEYVCQKNKGSTKILRVQYGF